MPASPPVVRRGEYAARGDYHRAPDPDWEYYPTYIAKLDSRAPLARSRCRRTRACSTRGAAKGCSSTSTAAASTSRGSTPTTPPNGSRSGSLTALPFADATFDRALCLDVLEHLAFDEQPRALAELHRVLRPGGELLVSVPNLAHLQSRVHFLLLGRLIRTASELKHPGDRPVGDYIDLGRARRVHARRARRGIFPTVPVVTRSIRRHPRALLPLHRWLTRLLPIPGWCFLNLLTFRKP